jgi:hypothetical protein
VYKKFLYSSDIDLALDLNISTEKPNTFGIKLLYNSSSIKLDMVIILSVLISLLSIFSNSTIIILSILYEISLVITLSLPTLVTLIKVILNSSKIIKFIKSVLLYYILKSILLKTN